MIEIKHEDKFYITGRGIVYTGTLENNIPLDQYDLEKFQKSGQPVVIDEKVWKVVGVERYAVGRERWNKHPEFGVLVKPYCTCPCHQSPGMTHFQACCDYTYTQFPKYEDNPVSEKRNEKVT